MNYGKNVSVLLASAIVLVSAFNSFADSAIAPTTPPYDLTANFKKISPDEIQGNIIKMISSDWMLITAGTEQKFNGMTAGWGGIGNWGKPAAFILVRNDRHTYKFLEQEEYFTLSFFDEKYRPALKLFGTKSGRDIDKTKEAGLTGIPTTPGNRLRRGQTHHSLQKRLLDDDNPKRSGTQTLFWRNYRRLAKEGLK